MANKIDRYKVFTKVKWDKQSIIYYLLLLFTSLFYGAFFNDNRIKLLSENNTIDISLTLYSISFCLLLFFVLILSKYIFAISVPILFYIGAISNIYASKFYLDTDKYTAPLFTSENTVSYIFNLPENLIYIIFMFIIGVLIAILRFFVNDNSTIRKGQIFAIIVILFFMALKNSQETDLKYSPMPASYFTSVKNYYTQKLHIKFFHKDKNIEFKNTNENNINIIYISIDKLSDNLFENHINNSLTNSIGMKFFNNINPCSDNIESSFICTTHNDNTNILSLYNKAGFNTYWTTISGNLIKNSLNIEKFAKSSIKYDNITNTGSANPFVAVNKIDEIIKLKGDKFIGVNIEGTLPDIYLRYPELYDNNNDIKYLNYVNYIDAFIYEIAKKVENYPSIIIFTGLIGETINNNIAKIGGTTYAGIWVSPLLQDKININNIENFNDKTIFNSLLHCGKINSSIIDTSNSLCK